MSTALVTGATGFVGSHLTRRLVADGWQVHALVRRPDAVLADGAGAVAIPTGVDEMIACVAGLAPDVCFHLATEFRGVHTPADIDPMIEANVRFGTVLAEAVASVDGCRFVNTGTVWQHFEARDYSPVSLYAATKQAFVDVLRYYEEVAGLPAVTLELADTYGPGDTRPKLVPALFDAARTGNRLDMTDGHQLVDLVHVDDAVGALLTVGAFTPEAPGTTFAAGGGTPVSLRELVAAVGRATGREIDVAWGARPGRPREMRSPWTTSPPPPGWSPCIALDEGLGALAETLGAGPRS